MPRTTAHRFRSCRTILLAHRQTAGAVNGDTHAVGSPSSQRLSPDTSDTVRPLEHLDTKRGRPRLLLS